MAVPMGMSSEPSQSGCSYAGVLVQVMTRPDAREELPASLRRLRFTGWVAPPEEGWVLVVARGVRTVAAGRRGVVGVGQALAEALDTATLAVRVLDDRQLVLVACEAGQETARYVSDPSREPGADEDVLPDPFGIEGADALAAACGRPEAGKELRELLAEPLDPDEEIESERLARVLRLLGLPSWLVTAWRLPRRTETGPSPRDLLRLGAGRPGLFGGIAGRAASLARRWRPPPPVLLDPPRGQGGDDLSMWV